MATSSSAAQPFCRPASLRFASARISVAKLRGFPHVFACAASNPTASVSARSAVPPRAEHVVDRIDDPLDTTLHDEEQSPGAIMTSNPHDGEESPGPIMTSHDKLSRAHRPARRGDGVDTIEVGFPAYLCEDFDAVQPIAMDMEVGYVVVVYKRRVIDATGEAGNPRIRATSKILKPEQEDARRSNRGGLEEEIKAAGTTLNILGSGYTLCQKFVKLNADIKANTPGVENATKSSSYCQHGIDLASANTSEGVFGGAFRLKVTIKGSGERARNTSLNDDLHGVREFKESSETTSSDDVDSTHENEFDQGKLSGNHTVGAKLVELGSVEEIKDPRECIVDQDVEDNKPPASRVHTITDFFNLMKAAIGLCGTIIGIRQQSPEFMWHPCLRDMALFGVGITLAIGLAAMYYGVVVVFKASESTSHST